ncbi:MAG: nucleotide exchange factor GrpE [Spirochaetales bacterium]|nr:MAG: nucleotide exchange factor GrpE [Spirochaetales bacterium]
MPNDGDTRDEDVVSNVDETSQDKPTADSEGMDMTGDVGAQQEDAGCLDGIVEGTDGDAEVQIAELELDVANLSDQLLRKAADFDNYRKRMLREKEEFGAYANRELLLDIVTIIDDFERAIRSADESEDFNAFHDGIVLIEKQFTSMLERKWKLARFESVGEEFDPQKHEAMMTEERTDHDQSMVLEDFQKGYMLHDRVLRPSKVKVSMPVEGGDGNGNSENTSAE